MKHIAIFASGGGSNALKIIEYFKQSSSVSVSLIVCNRKKAGVLEKARMHNIETLIINKAFLYESRDILKELSNRKIDLLVLAGFLMLIPEYLVDKYPGKIINIHPALLPKYGGQGMYGHHVHEAVKAAGDSYSGITIHFVDKNYDEGSIILQRKCRLAKKDSAEDIAKKVLKLEHKYYSITIEKLLSDT